jgi:lipid A disaccharide synthetase
VSGRLVGVPVEQHLRNRTGGLEQIGVAGEVGEAQQRRAALARAEVLARAAQ